MAPTPGMKPSRQARPGDTSLVAMDPVLPDRRGGRMLVAEDGALRGALAFAAEGLTAGAAIGDGGHFGMVETVHMVSLKSMGRASRPVLALHWQPMRIRRLGRFFFLLLLPLVQLGLNLVNDFETLVKLYGALPAAVHAVF